MNPLKKCPISGMGRFFSRNNLKNVYICLIITVKSGQADKVNKKADEVTIYTIH